jgi:hypothetical protein
LGISLAAAALARADAQRQQLRRDKQYGKFTEALGLAEGASRIRPNPNC